MCLDFPHPNENNSIEYGEYSPYSPHDHQRKFGLKKKNSVVVGCMRMVNRYVVLGVKYNENDVYYMP